MKTLNQIGIAVEAKRSTLLMLCTLAVIHFQVRGQLVRDNCLRAFPCLFPRPIHEHLSIPGGSTLSKSGSEKETSLIVYDVEHPDDLPPDVQHGCIGDPQIADRNL